MDNYLNLSCLGKPPLQFLNQQLTINNQQSNASLKGAQLDYTLELTDWETPDRVYRANLQGANLTNTIMPDGTTHE